MKFGVPWSVKEIRPEARESARKAARRSGVSVDEWLNSVIIQQAKQEGVQTHAHSDNGFHGEDLASVHQRLDDLTRRIEQLTRTGPAAYAPRRGHSDRDQFAVTSRPLAPPLAPAMPPRPSGQLPPSLDRAVAEITARRRALNGEPAAASMSAPLPAQDLSGLEDHLRRITDQIETLRKPGVEEAISALRAELGEIGRALNEAMPRRAIDTIEKQIQGLTQRIAESRQAGVDSGQLSGIERGLAEVRDALRGLRPAESLIGFNEAVAGLAHKIDLIVAEKDPQTLAQLENAIATLRDMVAHIASNETVRQLAAEVQALGEKVEQVARTAAGSDALNNLDHRITALADALVERAQSGGAVSPRLEALVESLTEKIERIQNSRGDSIAIGHLEDRIVSLVEKLDASDSRLGHLEAIERGLADLLVNIEHMRANKGAGALRADDAPGADEIKRDLARTQDALNAVHGTLGLVVDRLAAIEKNIRGETRADGGTEADRDVFIQPVDKLAVPMVSDAEGEPQRILPAAPLPAPPLPAVQAEPSAPAPRRAPAANRPPIDPNLPPDQPLEPGSGPPHGRANPAARIAASEAALGGARSSAATPAGGRSDFIAAARRAAQAAGQEPGGRAPRAEPIATDQAAGSSLGAKMMKRVKSLFIAASVIAAVVGSVQIGDDIIPRGHHTEMAKAPDTGAAKTDAAAPTETPAAPLSLAANPDDAPKPQDGAATIIPPAGSIASAPPLELDKTAQELPSLLNPPMLGSKGDVTGAISRPADASGPTPAQSTQPAQQQLGQLPTAIGGPRLRSAAAAGDAAADYEVGLRFAGGRGVPVNPEEAAHWFERAAAKGLAPAQFRYASLLEKGLGVKKDLVRAQQLYLAAATKGNAKAMHNLAVLYAEGIDGKPDYPAAAQWFRKAAEAGIADSQYNLGVLAARGLGGEKDMAESYKWFALAAAQGDREAAKKRDDIAAHLDAKALAAAKQAIVVFVPKLQPEEAVNVPAPPGGWDHAATVSPAPKARPQPSSRPLSLGSFTIGKR